MRQVDRREMVQDAFTHLKAQGLKPSAGDVVAEIELNYGVKIKVGQVRRLLGLSANPRIKLKLPAP